MGYWISGMVFLRVRVSCSYEEDRRGGGNVPVGVCGPVRTQDSGLGTQARGGGGDHGSAGRGGAGWGLPRWGMVGTSAERGRREVIKYYK